MKPLLFFFKSTSTAIGVASGNALYVFKNLQPFYKFVLPDCTVRCLCFFFFLFCSAAAGGGGEGAVVASPCFILNRQFARGFDPSLLLVLQLDEHEVDIWVSARESEVQSHLCLC